MKDGTRVYVVVDKDASSREKREAWIENRKEDARAIGRWIKHHKGETIFLATSLLGLTRACVKHHNKRMTIQAEKELKDRSWYDHRTGHYWHLKRELTSSEQLLVEERMKKGETLGKIFQDMNVLRK